MYAGLGIIYKRSAAFLLIVVIKIYATIIHVSRIYSRDVISYISKIRFIDNFIRRLDRYS